MHALEFLNQISEKTRLPVYFLFGEESFFVTEILARLNDLLIDENNRDFNLETFQAPASGPSSWIEAARTLSFFGGDKLVVVRGLDEVTLEEADQKLLLDYVDQPVAEACLVLCARKADRKRKLYKALTKIPGAVELSAPRPDTLIPWLKTHAKTSGYDLSTGAARMMLDRVGPRPGLLVSELNKTMTYAGKNKSLKEADVAAMVGDIRLEKVFALTDALKQKDAGQALSLLHNQLDHGEEPLKVLGMIAWQFRLIWEVRHHQKQRMPAARIAQTMGQKPFVVDQALRYTRNFSDQQLKNGFGSLVWADRELKTTGRDPAGIMESLILKLCA